MASDEGFAVKRIPGKLIPVFLLGSLGSETCYYENLLPAVLAAVEISYCYGRNPAVSFIRITVTPCIWVFGICKIRIILEGEGKTGRINQVKLFVNIGIHLVCAALRTEICDAEADGSTVSAIPVLLFGQVGSAVSSIGSKHL